MPVRQVSLLPCGTVRGASGLNAAAGVGPIVIMVHGYKYAPDMGAHCPHNSLYAPDGTLDRVRHRSWARALGLDTAKDALGIGFGWPARGSLSQVWARAEAAGCALAVLLNALHREAPHRPVRLLSHSMGARVVLAALPHVAAGAVERSVFLTPAVFQSDARAALDSPGGRAMASLFVTSTENTVFDVLLSLALRRTDPVLGCDQPGPTATMLRLEQAAALDALARLGFALAPRQSRVCHWSTYLRDGVFDLYRDILLGDLCPDALRAFLPPAQKRQSWRKRSQPPLALGGSTA